jgi:hypothetical protein
MVLDSCTKRMVKLSNLLSDWNPPSVSFPAEILLGRGANAREAAISIEKRRFCLTYLSMTILQSGSLIPWLKNQYNQSICSINSSTLQAWISQSSAHTPSRMPEHNTTQHNTTQPRLTIPMSIHESPRHDAVHYSPNDPSNKWRYPMTEPSISGFHEIYCPRQKRSSDSSRHRQIERWQW